MRIIKAGDVLRDRSDGECVRILSITPSPTGWRVEIDIFKNLNTDLRNNTERFQIWEWFDDLLPPENWVFDETESVLQTLKRYD